MERRVVKFNLVGSIFVIILIIASIVGIISIVKSLNIGSRNSNENNTSEEEPQEPVESKVKEEINVNGEIQEVVINSHTSQNLLYSLSYVPELLTVEKVSEHKEIIKSKDTTDVTVEIERFEDGFVNKSEELIISEDKKRKENSSYSMDTINLNGRLCYIEKRKKDEDLYMEYTIEYGKSYYHIDVHIGKDSINMYKPVIEKMLKGFKVI